MPRVTIVVPAFDAADTIGAALASVAAQTYADWEVVVGDDCSTDATDEIAAAAHGTRVVRTTGRTGPGGARNAALAVAEGELVALLDADDAWEPTYLERMVGAYDAEERRSPGVGIVCCDAQLIDAHDAPLGHLRDLVGTADGLTLDALLRRNPIFVGSLLPLAVVRELDGFHPEAWGSADFDLWLRILETGRRVVYVPEPLARYRLSEGQMSRSLGGMAATAAIAYRRALERDRLTPPQRRIARRELRLQEGVERVSRLLDARGETGRLPVREALRSAPRLARVAIEHPGRWAQWARGVRRGSTHGPRR
jgi:glycosyltransferase involved in cell wall biosynthesis